MKTTLILSFLIVSLFSSPAGAFDGPLRVKNQFPLFLHTNAPYLEKAAAEDSLTAGFSYSSVYLIRDSSSWSAHLDMEIAELALILKKNLKDFFEVGVEAQVLSFNSGFMDNFLNSYHSAFGFPDYGRHNRPEDEFLYVVKKNGVTIIKGENGRIGLGDLKFTIKKPLLSGDTAVSIKGSVELPTGDPKTGFGNGSVDAGIGVAADQKISEAVMSYLNFGAVFPGDLKGHAGIDLRDFLYGGAAVEAALWKDISLLGQVFFQGSPFPETGVGSVDRTAVLLSLGGRYRSGRNSFEVSFTEDPNTAGAPDFSCNFSLTTKF